jgi:hypothetical protein
MNTRTSDPAIRKRFAVGAVLVSTLLLALTATGYFRAADNNVKPAIALMTTLPLRWSEGNLTAALDPNIKPSGAYSRLAKIYKIDLLDNLDSLKPKRPTVLVLAQSRALAPQELVRLDNWVRDGGRLLVLADPALSWESNYPLGDNRRPLFTSMLSPLFVHWGLDLVLPMNADTSTEVRRINGLSVRMPTPGAWQLRSGRGAAVCTISAQGVLADCSIGKGKAYMVADADLLNEEQWQGTGARALMGSDDFGNMEWIIGLIDSLREGHKVGEFVGESE